MEAIVDGVVKEAIVDGVALKESPPTAQLERQCERSLIEWRWKESPSAVQLEKQWERRS